MDNIFLISITIVCIYYLYKKLFKSNSCTDSCSCGDKKNKSQKPKNE